MSETTNSTPVVLTKEEKLQRLQDQIAKLQQRYDDVLNDRVPQKKAAAPVYTPAVGDKVLATVGRKTATTNPTSEPGVVIAVRQPAEGEKGAPQVRVRIKEGSFEEQLVTLYFAQVVKIEEAADQAAE